MRLALVLAGTLVAPLFPSLGRCGSQECTLQDCLGSIELSGEVPVDADSVSLCRQTVCDVAPVPGEGECSEDENGELLAGFCLDGTTLIFRLSPPSDVKPSPVVGPSDSFEVLFKNADGMELERHTLDFQYEQFEVNGPDCGPTCFSGSASW